jgi:outer membrane protein TolC
MPLFRVIPNSSRMSKSILRVCLAAATSTAFAQPPASPAGAPPSPPAIALDDAIARARTNEPNFASAVAASKNAALDKSIARAALMPNVVYDNTYLYTQANHCPMTNKICVTENTGAGGLSGLISVPVRFIANNAVHEYVSQASVTETIGAREINAVSLASASLAVAQAELEIARRGLVASVAGLFYRSVTADRRVGVAERAAKEAASLTQLTQQRETAREVAHADVVKAQLQQQQRDRELADARLEANKARLELAVLLFPDPRAAYTLVVTDTPAPVPARADVEAALARRNPELESALASSHLADLNVTAARSAYLPDFQLNYSYGIDAAQFAANAYDGSQNLGYSASATLNIPVWDWFSTHDRVRQSEINRGVARKVLTNTQRKLIAELDEDYAEAVTAHDQLDSLNASVATATESLRLTRLSYASGETVILDVVDAENSLTVSELAREDGIVRYQTALANLQLLTGTL